MPGFGHLFHCFEQIAAGIRVRPMNSLSSNLMDKLSRRTEDFSRRYERHCCCEMAAAQKNGSCSQQHLPGENVSPFTRCQCRNMRRGLIASAPADCN